jgi:hypothetical protein
MMATTNADVLDVLPDQFPRRRLIHARSLGNDR